MINNLLKVVGVDSKDSSTPSSSPYSPNADYYGSSSSSHHHSANNNASHTTSPGENLASTLGGFLNNFQETFHLDGKAVVAGALDSTGAMGVMNHKSWNKSSSSSVGGSGSRSGGSGYKNVGGRGYYAGVGVGSGNKGGDAPQRQGGSNSSISSSSSSRGQKKKERSKKSSSKSSSSHQYNNKNNTNSSSSSAQNVNDGMYQGRKMVSDISHLYQVVDDKQAYENYDTLMEITANASAQAKDRLSSENHGGNSDGGSESSSSSRRGSRNGRRGSSRDSSQEQKQNWARMKEEELVDRMLSQFPEFGTNCPTPLTVMDDNDEDDDDDESHSFLRPLSKATTDGAKHNNMGANTGGGGGASRVSTAPPTSSESTDPHANNPGSASSTRYFTDDASDLIGRFFFGVPNTSNNAGATAGSAANNANNAATAGGKGRMDAVVGGPEDFRKVASFESGSSLSTMTSAGTGRMAGNNAVRGQQQRRDNGGGGNNNNNNNNGHASNAMAAAGENGHAQTTNNAALGNNDGFGNNDYSSDWDQDEMDLWSNKVSMTAPKMRGGGAFETGVKHAKALPKSIAASPQGRHSDNDGPTKHKDGTTPPSPSSAATEENWASRRRRHRERRKKRQDWDALRDVSHHHHQLAFSSGPGGVGIMPGDHPSSMGMPQFHPEQQTLLTALPDREPPSLSSADKKEAQKEVPGKQQQPGGGGAVIVDDGKQHWMPDNLCKHCYSCEAPFTLLRRKHHCRVCGMIFCSACSAYFVEISSSEGAITTDGKSAGTMRTCKMCYDHLSERGLGVIMRGGLGSSDTKQPEGGSLQQSKSSSDMNANKHSASTLSLDKMSEAAGATPTTRKGSARDILLPLTNSDSPETEKIMEESAGPELMEQFAGLKGGGGGSPGNFQALSITKKRLDEERRRREERERAEAAAAAVKAEQEAAALAEAKNTPGGRLKSRLGSVRQLKWKTSASNLESKKEDETIDADSDAVEVSVGGNHGGTQSNAADGIKAAASTLESSSGIEEALFNRNGPAGGRGQSNDAKISAKIHLGMVAAEYLEKLGRELLNTDAPLLLEEIKNATTAAGVSKSHASAVEGRLVDLWVNTLMTLATRCCATVEPDVKNGDLLDVRPYCKVKVIPGGSVDDSAYMSGVVFHKNVSHKKMARIIPNAKIMMLSGGIEYTRTENTMASLDTLLEQEERYMEILVTKMFKLKPDVLIVGKGVCRKAQELLLRANIVLIQYVKPTLMTRIARQTGATVLGSIDHVMNSTILGFCKRFRLVSFRDNDIWVDDDGSTKAILSDQKSVPVLLSQNIPNHERQAALAARKLGEGVLDGKDAVTLGLAKRGVVKTYVMIEGCPKELGCTVVLRGASRPALKMIKRVLRFLINCCYNMKLETSYILERCCRLSPTYKIPTTPCCSSSLCVDFGQPPNNRKARPWNGGKNDPAQRSLSGKITPLDHQAILITSVWMTEKTQCCPAEVKGICYYSMQDVSLGQFLRDSCFNLSLKCQNPSCKKSVIDHSLSFIHNDGLINISVEKMDNPIPMSSLQKEQQQKDLDSSMSSSKHQGETSTTSDYEPIATWTYCTKCNQVVTPLIFLSKQTWQWSFGKFLEVFFYNRDAIINAPGHRCSCRMQTSSQLFFGCGSLAARFTYEKISPYSVFCRRHLPFDETFHKLHSLQDLEHISNASSSLFVKYDKQIEAISRETRELFGSAMNKPEHLQAVLSELNLVSAEVDNASKVLQEKISSVTAKYSKQSDSGKTGNEYNEVLFNVPWYSRRYLFMLASAWNERLSAAGQALVAMKKVQHAGGSGRGDSTVAPTIVGDASAEEVIEGMKRIRLLQETYSRNYNVAKMTMPRSQKGEPGGLFEGNILPDGRVATLEQEAEIDDEEFYSDPDNDIDFEDDVDADVLASRNRVYSPQSASQSSASVSEPKREHRSSRDRHQHPQRPTKVLGGKRPSDMILDESSLPTPTNLVDQSASPSLGFANNYDSSGQLESQGKIKTVTAGGAVKSALNRFFNRGSNKEDPYIVDLGIFGQGRPRLSPGIGGLVIPVVDDHPSTIIAHSLASSDYDVQFKQFLNATSSFQPDTRGGSDKHHGQPSRKDIERRMLGRNKSHIKHTFRDFDEKGQQLCKFVCTTFWSVQFNSVRQAFMNPHISSKDNGENAPGSSSKSSFGASSNLDIEKSYIRSLAQSFAWAASGGKSGAAFSRTTDDRFVIKCISRTELQMFLDCAPAYFEYLSKAFFHGLPTVLCKIVGVYQIGYHNRVTGRRTMEQVAVMQNIFFGRKISKIFDLKGSLRGRFTGTKGSNTEKEKPTSKKTSKHYGRSKSDGTSGSEYSSSDEDDDDSDEEDDDGTERDEKTSSNTAEKAEKSESIPTLLDGDFLEFTSGRPLPLTDRAKAVFHMSILNDTLFLSIINVLDYSILVGIDEEKMELVVGIIDFMRQYDILKQMERVGKSLPMVVGSEAPTIIQPPLYKARFTNAMERYFMTVPSKWTTI